MQKLLLVLWVMFGWTAIVGAQTTSTKPAEKAGVGEFPSYGVAFSPPEGGMMVFPKSPSHVAKYGFAAGTPQASCGILVEIIPLKEGQTLNSLTQYFVTKGGAILDTKVKPIAGEPAVKLTARFIRDKVTHRTTYLVGHGKFAYLFSALDTEDASAVDLLNKLLSTVKWLEIEAPDLHLAERFQQPVILFDAAKIAVPSVMRGQEQAADYLELGIYDNLRHAPSLLVEINLVQLAQPITFAEIKDKFSALLKEKNQLAEDLKWTQSEKLGQLYSSQVITQGIKLPNGLEHKFISRYSVLDCGNGKQIQILYNIPVRPDLEPKPYLEAVERMIESVEIMKSKDEK